MNSVFVTEKTAIKRTSLLLLNIDIPFNHRSGVKYMKQICVPMDIMIKNPMDGVIYLTRMSGMRLLETPLMTINKLIFLTG